MIKHYLKNIFIFLLFSLSHAVMSAPQQETSTQDNKALPTVTQNTENDQDNLVAKPAEMTLTLKQISSSQTSEKSGDEVYIDIFELSDDRRPKKFHIPKYPHHWPSVMLSKVKNIPLWQGRLNPTGEVKLIVSLLDKDAPPWNNNDLIGAAEIYITVENNTPKIILKVDEPNQKPQTFNGYMEQSISFQAGAGAYSIDLLLK